jgi:hypothetical protein
MRIAISFIVAFIALWALGIGSAWVVSLVATSSLLGAGAVMWVGTVICIAAFWAAVEILEEID